MRLQKLIVDQFGPSFWLYSCLSLKIRVSIFLKDLCMSTVGVGCKLHTLLTSWPRKSLLSYSFHYKGADSDETKSHFGRFSLSLPFC